MKKRILALVLAVMLTVSLLPVTAMADGGAGAAVTLGNGGWPYGKDMDSSSVTLVMEATGAASYQWQSKAIDGTEFSDLAGQTSSTLTLSSPTSGTWYRCVVSGTASKAVQVVQPDLDADVNGCKWTAFHASSFDASYYLTNGTVAYTSSTNGSNLVFDVTGLYVKGETSYMLQTSYDRSWELYSTDSATPNATGYSFSGATLKALKAAFDETDHYAVHFTAVLGEGQKSFAIGADTQLGNSVISGEYADCAALIADLRTDGKLKQIKMLCAKSEANAKGSDPAFVIAPQTDASCFWLGYYSSRTAYIYNELNNSDHETYYTRETVSGTENVVTKMEGGDSGMTLSWLNVPNGEVKFLFKVGTAAATGAIGAGSISTPTDTASVDLNGHTELDASKITVKVNGTALAPSAYTAKIENDTLTITFHASAGLKHGDVIFAEIGKTQADGVERISIANNIPEADQTPLPEQAAAPLPPYFFLAALHRCEWGCPICGGCMDRTCSNEKCAAKCQLPGIHAAEVKNTKYR